MSLCNCSDQCEYVIVVISVRWAKTLNVAIFSDTITMINVKLCIMLLLTALYPFIPLSVMYSMLVSKLVL